MRISYLSSDVCSSDLWGLATGVTSIIIEMEPIWLLRLVQLYFRVTPLGLPKRYGPNDVVAVVAKFDSRTLARLREMGSEERRVGKECVSTCRSRWSPDH